MTDDDFRTALLARLDTLIRASAAQADRDARIERHLADVATLLQSIAHDGVSGLGPLGRTGYR